MKEPRFKLCARLGCAETADHRFLQHDQQGRVVQTCEAHRMNAADAYCPAAVDGEGWCACPPTKGPRPARGVKLQ
jgi:hypothetical protein